MEGLEYISAIAEKQNMTVHETVESFASVFYDCMVGGHSLPRIDMIYFITFLKATIPYLYSESEFNKRVRLYFTLERLVDGVSEYHHDHDEGVLCELKERAKCFVPPN